MTTWTLRDLEYWDDKIREKVAEFGLDCYPQEFEVCDQNAMLGYMAYHGMPSHYPHWSFGKAFEQTKTMYDHGVQGLPYEMVINSNPCLAYLMRDNSLCLQVLTIAHVYGHNDFFKNNFTFTTATNAAETLASFKTRADRMRRYIEDPSIGSEQVELFLDAAHALSFSALAQPGDQAARARAAADPADRGRHADPGRVVRPAQARGDEAARPQPRAARARGQPPPLHPRPQPRARRLAARRADDRRRGGALLPAADRDQDHERGLGQPLAPPDHDEPRPAAGDRARVHGPPQPGDLPAPGRPQPVPCRLHDLARHREALRRRGDEGGPGQAVRGPRERPRRGVPAPLPHARADARARPLHLEDAGRARRRRRGVGRGALGRASARPCCGRSAAARSP